MATPKAKTVGDNLFCSATLRPDCIRNRATWNSLKEDINTNLCCLHCTEISKCQSQNRSKVKPCTIKVCSFDDVCEFSI